jgi:nitrite transporter
LRGALDVLGLFFWLCFAFVACGFEHSVVNMFLFALALIGPHPESVTLARAAANLVSVTIGNLVGGSVFMSLGYWLQDRHSNRSQSGMAVPDSAGADPKHLDLGLK